MKRNNNMPFYPSAMLRGADTRLQPESKQFNVPEGFKEAMKWVNKLNDYQNTQIPEMDSKIPAIHRNKGKMSVMKWKSSFKPIDDPDDNSPQDGCPDDPERSELYDPYNPVSPDSEHDISQGQGHSRSLLKQEDNPEPQPITINKSRWDVPAAASRPPERDDRGPDNGPSNSRARATEPFVPAGYGSAGRSLDQRVGSPERHILRVSPQRFPASYRPQRPNDDERMISDYRGEVTARGRPSPPRLKRNSNEFGYCQTSMDEIPSRTKRLVMERIPVICDLCDIELLDCQELQDHLESRTHWNTMEHIQQENNYDDLTVAFLQEVMLHKSRRFSHPIEDSFLEALHENDHMTKVEVFHCAVCETFVSSSASSVRAHVMSQAHLTSIKRFDMLQRAVSLDRAQAMMEELKPQFQHFLKGGNPFE
ncbi:DBIRD complex subunit ZNF326-like [Takifugu flavidus]|uniref:DBIRD complex subunit ZNF326-like n=1 Tax=Takifugu flavidus TaxID=433684 RepID=UPI002544B579|nr:DBIRD complex subunit ZNF326-like [Takifugu flavidus]